MLIPHGYKADREKVAKVFQRCGSETERASIFSNIPDPESPLLPLKLASTKTN